ncbi:MAG TPA: hypothetical protein VFN20_03390 [Candidatus Acidoferrum sp.]|nr:hypothetical protein [Candidatus Acidoferrum sp.]
MSKQAVLRGFLVLAGALASSIYAAAAVAQSAAAEKPALYTYVSEWAVPRAMWADYKKEDDADLEAMKKAFTDGTIVSYGSFAVLNHQEGSPTHGSWFSAISMANLMKVLEGLRSSPGATAPVLAASKHWDFILRSTEHNGHAGTFTNGYLRVARWPFKAGANDPDEKILKATMVSMLEKLLADGAIHSYTIDRENIHSEDPGSMFVVFVTNGAEGLDKFNAAVTDMQKNNPTGLAAYTSLIDSHGHRDTLARVTTMTNK